MKDSFVRVLFFIFIVILIAASLLTYRNLENYIDEVAGIRQSNQVVAVTEAVLSAVRDAETGHRGYQLTRDTIYLQPYYEALKTLPRNLKLLDSLVQSDIAQSHRVDTLGILINSQFSITNQILSNAKRSSLYMDKYESALLLRGRKNMDNIRDICRFITQNEQVSFRQRVTKETVFRDNAPLTVLGYSLIALIGMTFLFTRIIHELTLRKQAEKDMLIAERLSLTGKIARTIAHEVRNPLTNLTLALDQLKDEMPPENESVKLYGDIIERNAGRIEQLIDEMLSSSRPKELHLELTSMETVLEETLTLTIDRLNLNQMKLVKNFEAGLPRILLDKEQIKVALVNIFINAVEAMKPEEGVLTLTTKHKDGCVVILIKDNGKGIEPSEIEKLFDPFYTGKSGGMGLGLTTTRNIINGHNAKVEVHSKPNQGTTFSIFFKLPPN